MKLKQGLVVFFFSLGCLLPLCGRAAERGALFSGFAVTDVLSSVDRVSEAAGQLDDLYDLLPQDRPEVKNLRQQTTRFATALTAQAQAQAYEGMLQSARSLMSTPGISSETGALIGTAVAAANSTASTVDLAGTITQAMQSAEIDRLVSDLVSMVDSVKDEDDAWDAAKDFLELIKDPDNAKLKRELLQEIERQEWPSERAKESLINTVNAFGREDLFSVAENNAIIFTAETVRHSCDGKDKALQETTGKIADYIEAVGFGGGEGARQYAINDIKEKITNPVAQRQMLEVVNKIGKEGVSYLDLAGNAVESLSAEGIYRLFEDPEKGLEAVDAFYRGDDEMLAKLIGGEAYNRVGTLIAGRVREILYDKLDEHNAERLSRITDALITAGTDEALRAAQEELRKFIEKHAPGDSAGALNAWIDSLTDESLTDDQRDLLRTQAFKSVTKGYSHQVIDDAKHLSDEEKKQRKAEIDQKIDSGDYTGALVDIGAVAVGSYVEGEFGPGTGEGAEDVVGGIFDPEKSWKDVGMDALKLGVVAGKNWLNNQVGEWVDGYLARHPEAVQALAFFGLDGESIKKGVSNVLNVLTDFNTSAKEKFAALANLAKEALLKIATAVIQNVINTVKELIQQLVTEAIGKLQALIQLAENKINAWLKDHGGLITVKFSSALNTWVEQTGTRFIRDTHSKLDVLGGFLQQETEKAIKKGPPRRQHPRPGRPTSFFFRRSPGPFAVCAA